MKNEIELRHIFDLAERSYNNNRYMFTQFLTTAELTDFYDSVAKLPPCGYTVFGGFEGAERVIIRFGSEEELGYSEEFPIVYLCVEPVAVKFSEELTHRDVLGSLMNLGIKRELLGDILIKDKKIWVLCSDSMAEYIMKELVRIRHTTVKCHIENVLPDDLKPNFEELKVQVASARLDGVVAKLCKLSRNSSAALFAEGKVAVNGRQMQNHSYILKEGDVISVRGYGKFRFISVCGNTRKGNIILEMERYV